jgi:hypothetical protein
MSADIAISHDQRNSAILAAQAIGACRYRKIAEHLSDPICCVGHATMQQLTLSASLPLIFTYAFIGRRGHNI